MATLDFGAQSTSLELTSAAPQTIVTQGSGTLVKIVNFITAFNNDTFTHTVTIRFGQSGANYTVWEGDLGVGEMVHIHGPFVVDHTTQYDMDAYLAVAATGGVQNVHITAHFAEYTA
jgi:hypothetical protein